MGSDKRCRCLIRIEIEELIEMLLREPKTLETGLIGRLERQAPRWQAMERGETWIRLLVAIGARGVVCMPSDQTYSRRRRWHWPATTMAERLSHDLRLVATAIKQSDPQENEQCI
jgi:hypothetical protein